MAGAPAEGDHHLPGSAAMATTARRKGTSIRQWLVVSGSGESHLEEVGKHSIMRRTGLPARDLRVLDPLLSYPSTILSRERAIVTNLEHIKAVITSTEVLVPNSKDPLVVPFIHDLQTRIVVSQPETVRTEPACRLPSLSSQGNEPIPGNSCGTANSSLHNLSLLQDKAPKVLTFEFRALEVCLESACRCLESEAATLEQEAYPALDELPFKISTVNLQLVRKIKSRLVAISSRVQKVRDELEHLLHNDMDMAEMHLTEKLAHQCTVNTSSRVDPGNETFEVVEERDEAQSRNGRMVSFKPNIVDLKVLLESYFVQIEGTSNKLSALREYVDDTEDYVKIILDKKQNQLLDMGAKTGIANLVCDAANAVVGIFGINITINLYNVSGSSRFWETTVGTVFGCIILYFIAIGWGRRSGLLH